MLPKEPGPNTSKPLEVHTKNKNIIRIPRLAVKIDASRGSIYNWMNPKSDQYQPNFPRPIRIGKRAIGWLEDEVDKYLADLATSRDQNRGAK